VKLPAHWLRSDLRGLEETGSGLKVAAWDVQGFIVIEHCEETDVM